jgi:hemolysin activation/secretion protein
MYLPSRPCLLVALAAWPCLAAVAAPTAPSAGDLLRESPAAVQAPRAAAEVLPRAEFDARKDLQSSDDLKVRVQSLQISGVSAFPQASVLALVDDARGQELNFTQLQELAGRISRYYREHGYLVARAYLPAQKIVDGAVQIVVREGQLGKVHLEAVAPLDAAPVEPYLARLRQAEGEPLRTEPLEHDLLLLNDLPGVKVQSVLRPGAAVGATDLDVQVRRERAVTGSVTLDNFGNHYTGEASLTGRVNIASPWRFGDSLDLMATISGRGYRYGRADWQTPVGSEGLQVGSSGALMAYQLGQEFSNLNASGRASGLSFYALKPLVRSRATKLQAGAVFDIKQFDDVANGAESHTRSEVLALGLGGRSKYASGASSLGAVNLIVGHLQLDNLSAATDAAAYRRAGNYAKLSFQGEYQSPWGWATAVVQMAGQVAVKNLDTSEKMSLGGPQGVRAYAVGEVSSDDALLFSAELRHAVSHDAQIKLFFDAGHGRAAHSPLPTDITNQHSLAGAGIGLDMTLPAGLLLQAAVAWRTAGTPSPDLDRKPRFWMLIGKSF